MRVTLAATLLSLAPVALAAQPALAQTKRGSVYLSLMGEPFTALPGQSPLASWLAVADVDRNGMISLAELTIDAGRFFTKLDADGDKRIGGEEMTRYEQQIAPAALRAAAGARPVESTRRKTVFEESASATRADQSRGQDNSATPFEESGRDTGPSMSSSIPQPVAMTDSDMSGSVTPEEFARAAARRFLTHDRDKNGLLDAGELTVSRGR